MELTWSLSLWYLYFCNGFPYAVYGPPPGWPVPWPTRRRKCSRGSASTHSDVTCCRPPRTGWYSKEERIRPVVNSHLGETFKILQETEGRWIIAGWKTRMGEDNILAGEENVTKVKKFIKRAKLVWNRNAHGWEHECNDVGWLCDGRSCEGAGVICTHESLIRGWVSAIHSGDKTLE